MSIDICAYIPVLGLTVLRHVSDAAVGVAPDVSRADVRLQLALQENMNRVSIQVGGGDHLKL